MKLNWKVMFMNEKLIEYKKFILELEKEFLDNKKDRKIIVSKIIKKLEELDINEAKKPNS